MKIFTHWKAKSFKISAKYGSRTIKYINDYNKSYLHESIDDYDVIKEPQAPSRDDAFFKSGIKDELYPDPEVFHQKVLNKSRFDGSDRTNGSIIKICKQKKIIKSLNY